MKKYLRIFPLTLIFALLATSFLPSCKKYDDGPVFSFTSREERVTNDWSAVLVSRNDLDETKLYEFMHLDFKSGGQFEWKVKKIGDATDSTLTATWELATLDSQIKLSYADPVTSEPKLLYFDIKKLKEKEMWLDYLYDGDRYHLQLQPR